MDKHVLKKLHEQVEKSDIPTLATVAKEYARIAFDCATKFKRGIVEQDILLAYEFDNMYDCINLLNRIGERMDYLVNMQGKKNEQI